MGARRNEDFLAKATAEVLAKEEEKVQAWNEKTKNHRERIKELME